MKAIVRDGYGSADVLELHAERVLFARSPTGPWPRHRSWPRPVGSTRNVLIDDPPATSDVRVTGRWTG